MNRYAYACYVAKDNKSHTGVGFVRATSLDEAVGKSLRYLVKYFPVSKGWENHHTVCVPETQNDSDPDAVEEDAA